MNYRATLVFLHDATAVALTWLLAYWLRFNLDLSSVYAEAAAQALLWVVPLQAIVFWRLGLYRGIWRYASLEDLKRIVWAIVLSAVLVVGVVLMFHVANVPRSVLILAPILLAVVMGGSRLAYRVYREHQLYGHMKLQGAPVLVLGAGEAAVRLLKELTTSHEWRVVGLLDDNTAKHGRMLNGIPVLGAVNEVALHAAHLEAQHVILAMPSSTPSARRHAMEVASEAGLTVLTVPAFSDLLSGRVSISQIRKVELEDLLGREQVQLDDAGLHELLTNKVILVTGGGGSIGAELARQIANFEPKRLVILDQSEFALYNIEQEFSARFPLGMMSYVVGDVKDSARLNEVFVTHQPSVVFHAAAYKHVPLMEQENADEAVRNNVLGTLRLAEAAQRHGAEEFVLISTDKAVNPTNVMGASKRLAEMVCQAVGETTNPADAVSNLRKTRFVTVRFGNVLGSNGSVIPKFREQIAKGGPVTVTHADITRYFMSIPEAAQLVLQAGLMGGRTEIGGDIFVLDMGEPVKIVDLARDMIRLSGFTEEEVRIEITGLRPGEKLYEELLADDEQTVTTPHPKLRIAQAQARLPSDGLDQIRAWLEGPIADEKTTKARLKQFVPEYQAQQLNPKPVTPSI